MIYKKINFWEEYTPLLKSPEPKVRQRPKVHDGKLKNLATYGARPTVNMVNSDSICRFIEHVDLMPIFAILKTGPLIPKWRCLGTVSATETEGARWERKGGGASNSGAELSLCPRLPPWTQSEQPCTMGKERRGASNSEAELSTSSLCPRLPPWTQSEGEVQ